MTRTSLSELIYMNSYWVGLSFMWNGLHQLILPAVLLHLVPETQKNTYLGLLTFIGLVIATIMQPISGALSDRWHSKWGRRRPLILIGTAFDYIFLALLGWAGGLGWLTLGYLGLQLSSNLAHGPLQGLLPDRVPKDQLGQASGLKNLMDMSGLVIASLVIGRLLSLDESQPVTTIALIGLVLGICALVTLLGVREHPSTIRSTEIVATPQSSPEPINPKEKRRYAWLIASRFAFLIGVYDIQAFAQYYVRDVLSPPNPVKLTGDLMAVIALSLIAFAVIGGWLGDRVGHKRVLILASAIGALGCVLLLWARTPMTLLAFGSVLGAGTGLFITTNWALANALAPVAKAGQFLGLTNLATAGAGALGRLAGPLIDFFNNSQPGANLGYTMLFVWGALCLLLSAWLLRWVPLAHSLEK